MNDLNGKVTEFDKGSLWCIQNLQSTTFDEVPLHVSK